MSFLFEKNYLESPSDPYKMDWSLPKIMGSLAHFLRVMETPGMNSTVVFPSKRILA